MQNTTNLGLGKPLATDNYDIDIQNTNMDKIDTAVGDLSEFKVAGGTANAIVLTIPSITAYKVNQKISIIASANNNGTTTTVGINALAAKNLYKPNTTTAPTLIAGKAYDIWYNGTSFFVKASAEGNAVVANVLAGSTFSNDSDTGLVGTMPNQGNVGTQNLTSEAQEYTIPAGYHNGLGKVKAVITGLLAAVIKAGVTVGGVVGTFTSDANALASQMLSGVTAYVNGAKITGNITSKGVATITPGTANQTIAAGQYLSGTQTILGDSDLIGANLKQGIDIFGVAGTFKGYVEGTTPHPGYSPGWTRVSGLGFRPAAILVNYQTAAGSLYRTIAGVEGMLSIADLPCRLIRNTSEAGNVTIEADGFHVAVEGNAGGNILWRAYMPI